MDKNERIARQRERETRTQERDGVLVQHRERLANDPEYREAALTAPSITEKRGIHEKVLERTTPTALSASEPVAPADFDVETATKDELVSYADANEIDVKKSAKVDEIRAQIRDAS
jgi:hypothetical protein